MNYRLEYQKQEYAKSGRRAATPYITGECIDVPLATTQERMVAWIANAPYESERLCRIAYQEAFNAALAVGMWEALQAVPSYVETQAQAFAQEVAQ